MRSVLLRLALLSTLVMVAVPAAAVHAAPRMQIGFFDDPSFRWSAPKAILANMKAAGSAHASIIHLLADWSQIAPTKPKNALNGDDPAYNLTDLDAAVRTAPNYGLQVYVTITNTPKWANGGQTVNHPPTHLSDLTNFAHMLAARYNGRRAGFGAVTYWSVWNEPNLALFLTPQFAADGHTVVSGREYAKLYAAAYKGIKAGNPKAKVAIGETSNRGHNHHTTGNASDSTAPATFAHAVAVANPHLKFDAWSTHPYPVIGASAGPLQKVAYPNVALTNISKFAASLKQWFHRTVPIWVTEWAEQTRPQFSLGVSYAKQAQDAKTALKLAQANPNIQMFIWFVLRDSTAQTWFSGLETKTGSKKPSFNAFAATAKTMVGVTQTVSSRATHFSVTVPVPYVSYYVPPGSPTVITWKLYQPNGKTLEMSGASRNVRTTATQTVTFPVKLPKKYHLIKGLDYVLQVSVANKRFETSHVTVAVVGS